MSQSPNTSLKSCIFPCSFLSICESINNKNSYLWIEGEKQTRLIKVELIRKFMRRKNNEIKKLKRKFHDFTKAHLDPSRPGPKLDLNHNSIVSLNLASWPSIGSDEWIPQILLPPLHFMIDSVLGECFTNVNWVKKQLKI